MKDENIIIREARKGDETGIRDMIKYSLKKKAMQYTSTTSYSKKKFEQLKQMIALKKGNVKIFVAENIKKRKIVGNIMYSFQKKCRTMHRIDLGWGVHPDYMNKGIGIRLLNAALADAKKKGYKRAEAEVAIENKASVKMALKCGFKIEGRKRKGLLLDDGRMVDTYVLGKIL